MKSEPEFLEEIERYSYSLYLVNAPVLVTVWFAMGPNHSHVGWLVRAGVSVVCIWVATVFIYRVFERPSLGWVRG